MISLTMIFLILSTVSGIVFAFSHDGEVGWIAKSLLVLFGALFLLSFLATLAR